MSRVDRPTGFVTFDTTGSHDIGRGIASLSFALPGVLEASDQLDMLGVIGGPSADGGRELLAFGLGYRLDLRPGLTLFANVDYSDYVLGAPDTMPLRVTGSVSNMAFGVQREWRKGKSHRVQATFTLGARDEDGQFIGGPTIDESLRFVRLSLRDRKGAPFAFGRRYSLAVTQGIGALGASLPTNPLASDPGIKPDFFRVSAAAEMSLPLEGQMRLNVGIVGQWTGDSLPVSQRCGYGTNAYARGFDRSYVNGDACLGGRAELAFDVRRADGPAPIWRATQLFAGFDTGRVWDNTNEVRGAARDDWNSLSAGLRVLRDNIVGELQVTRILDKPAGAFEQPRARIWLRLAARF